MPSRSIARRLTAMAAGLDVSKALSLVRLSLNATCREKEEEEEEEKDEEDVKEKKEGASKHTHAHKKKTFAPPAKHR